jgi:hypothetical protein
MKKIIGLLIAGLLTLALAREHAFKCVALKAEINGVEYKPRPEEIKGVAYVTTLKIVYSQGGYYVDDAKYIVTKYFNSLGDVKIFKSYSTGNYYFIQKNPSSTFILIKMNEEGGSTKYVYYGCRLFY